MTDFITQTLPVNQLKPGMVLCGIVQQTGRLEVKHKGKIRHKATIEQLVAAGVSSVKIETAQTPETPAEPSKKPVSVPTAVEIPETDDLLPLDEEISADDPNLDKALDMDSDIDIFDLSNELEEPDDEPVLETSLSQEASRAEQLIIASKKFHKKLRISIDDSTKINIEAAKALVDDVHDSLTRNPDALMCLSMIRNEGEYLTNHAMRVCVLLCHFSKYLGMPERDCRRMALLGYLFDIGMLKVPKDILNKQGKMSVEEQAQIQAHVQYSLELLAPLGLDPEILFAIEQHHERMDGSGYPNRMKGEDIHIYSRMLAIIDCYEAMTTNRPFQKKCSPANALKIISDDTYGYDLKLALKFIRCIGVYPVGSLVVLSDQRIAMVIKQTDKSALKPIVRIFYSIPHNDYIEQSDIDLSEHDGPLKIEQPTLPEHYRLDMRKVEL